MKKIHIALAVKNLESSINEYSRRLGSRPVVIVEGQYALWRTTEVNLSISEKPDQAGQLRHLGFEDPEATEMSTEYDINGLMWEQFTAIQQRDEILQHYPQADYPASLL